MTGKIEDSAAMRLPTFQLEHLHAWSRDPEATARGYVEMFGAQVLDRLETANGLRVILSLGGTLLFVEQASDLGGPARRTGLEHFALATEQFDDTVDRLRAMGCVFETEPRRARPNARIAFVEVPGGGRVEIVELQPKGSSAGST